MLTTGENGYHWKRMTVRKLLEILADVPPGWVIECNAVNNFLLSHADGTKLAYIDIAGETIGLFDDVEEEG